MTEELSGAENVTEETTVEPQEEVASEPVVARKYKVKVDEAEEEVDEEELLKGYQNSRASTKRFQEASKAKKEAEQMFDLIKQVKENPDLLEQLGIDLDGYAEKRLLRNLERSMKTPEELELEEYRSEKSRRESTQKQQQEEAEFSQVSQEIDNEIFDSLQNAGLKPTPRLIARLAEQMLASLDDKGNRMKASEAFVRVRKDYQSDVNELLENLTPEQLAAEYPALVKKLRTHAISQAQSAQLPSFKAGATPKQVTEVKPKRRSIDEILG